MNIFYIPSWYPSYTDQLTGCFFRDQAIVLAKNFPEANVGISTWGQNDERLLLWSSRLLSSMKKLLTAGKISSTQNNLLNNAVEFFTPAFTWSWKIKKGNIDNIIDANLKNYSLFKAKYGKVDVIHAHTAFPGGYIAMKISRITGVSYIITEHMSPFPFKYFVEKNGKLADRIRYPYNRSKVNIAVSFALADKMTAFGVPNIKVIHNSVDEQIFQPPKDILPSDPFTFFTLGRMTAQKGIDILLKAIKLIPPDKKIRFRIGGDGENLEAYKKLAIKLDIDKCINWLGNLNQAQVASEMQNCHAFVLPSRHESMGIVFAEAIACGKPVIGTSCGGPEEIINNTNGYLILPENSIERHDRETHDRASLLANAIRKMIENYSQFDPKTIRADFLQRYSSKIITAQIMRMYEGVTDNLKS